MAEYDAFGNKIEEGGPSKPNPVPSSESAGIPADDQPATPKPATPAPTGLKLSGRPSAFSGGVSAGPWIAVIVLIVVIGGGALVAWQATKSADKVIRSFTPTFPKLPNITVATPETPESPTPEAPAKPKPPPVGLGPRSLIRHAAFASAIAKLRSGQLGHLTYVRVAPDRIDAQLVTNGGRLRNVQVGTDGEVRQLGGLSSPGFSPPTVAFADIDTRAPERLVRGGVSRGGVKSNGIDYLVISKFGDDVVWNAFFKNNVRYQGDQSGHVERKF